MTKLLLAIGASSLAVASLPADAQDHPYHCERYRHGSCIAPAPHEVTESARARGVGYRFGPSYHYVSIAGLPPSIVRKYHLDAGDRFVTENGYLYVVSPRSYRVVRAIPTP